MRDKNPAKPWKYTNVNVIGNVCNELCLYVAVRCQPFSLSLFHFDGFFSTDSRLLNVSDAKNIYDCVRTKHNFEISRMQAKWTNTVIDSAHLLSACSESSMLSALYGVSSVLICTVSHVLNVKNLCCVGFQLNLVWVFRLRGIRCGFSATRFFFGLLSFTVHSNMPKIWNASRSDRKSRARKIECVNGINLYCLYFWAFFFLIYRFHVQQKQKLTAPMKVGGVIVALFFIENGN